MKKYSLGLMFTLGIGFSASSQQNYQIDTLKSKITVAAGPEYKTSSFHQWLWGRNYRKEWATPVTVPVAGLDTMMGGITPSKAAGGNQTRSLQVKTAAGKTYTFRSVNKTLGKVLPENFLGTFIEDLVNDKVSMSHPYGAAAVPNLARNAGVYHTLPRYVYLPKQPRLDSFNKKYGNEITLFEQRVDDDWRDAKNLGNFSKYIGTDKLIEKLKEDNDVTVDQKQYVRSRLFDMFINDWDRHEDQWEWGETEKGDKKLYTPVPKDRDQAFFNYNGVLLKFLIGASGLKYFQQFDEDIKDVKTFNYEQRNSDRLFANELTRSDWQQIAKELQQSLTDAVIEASVKQMPPEIHPISGAEIIRKLKGRRDKLADFATTYYEFIARQVDIPASEKRERFVVRRLNENDTEVRIFKINKQGETKKEPIYQRTFKGNETKEVRLYGISGEDVYTVSGPSNNIRIRLIGGSGNDSMNIEGGKVDVYDSKENNIINGSSARTHLSDDSSIHNYEYKSFLYSKRGISPSVFFTNEDRLLVGLNYSILTHAWRKEPYASKQKFSLNYSISQKAFSFIYHGLFPEAVGKWDLDLFGTYDAVRWINFFGLGNETRFLGDDIDFYRARTEDYHANVGLVKRWQHHKVGVTGYFQHIRVKNDTNRFVGKTFVPFDRQILEPNMFGGARLNYTFVTVNDSIVPTKGVIFNTDVSYTQNLKETERNVAHLGGHLQVYIPLFWKFSLGLRAGSETVMGEPEFYQYATIGGTQTLKAFRRGRFWGKTTAYNSNELRFISDVKSYLYNGKLGLVAFYDNGRVWMPNENSNVWHTGYGGGVIISPFNALLAEVTYGISNDENLIQLRLTRKL